jgi:tight adherence protein B
MSVALAASSAALVLAVSGTRPARLARLAAERRAARRRHDDAARALPDALRGLAAELSAGRTLDRALDAVGTRVPAALAVAFAQAARRMRHSSLALDALRGALPRDGSGALVLAALTLQRRTGGDLPRLLRTLATTVEDRGRVEAEIRSLTAQARFSARAVPLLPPLGLAVLGVLDPEAVVLELTTPVGILLVAVSCALDLTGALLIHRLARSIES